MKNEKIEFDVEVFNHFFNSFPRLNRFLKEPAIDELLPDANIDKLRLAALSVAVDRLVTFKGEDNHWSYDNNFNPLLPASADADLSKVTELRDSLLQPFMTALSSFRSS